MFIKLVSAKSCRGQLDAQARACHQNRRTEIRPPTYDSTMADESGGRCKLTALLSLLSDRFNLPSWPAARWPCLLKHKTNVEQSHTDRRWRLQAINSFCSKTIPFDLVSIRFNPVQFVFGPEHAFIFVHLATCQLFINST